MKPNILIFNPDQMRADVMGYLGNRAAHTPHFDAFAHKDAVSFSNAFCQSPVCTPSRCSFMTGWYPHVHGHRTISYLMRDPEPILLTQLKNNGYYVWINNRNDLLAAQKKGLIDKTCNERSKASRIVEKKTTVERGEKGNDNYYSFYRGLYDTNEYEDMDHSDVMQLIQFIKNRPKNKPLCMFIGLLNPHPPYVAFKKYFDLIDKAQLSKRIQTPNWNNKPSILQGLYELFNLGAWSESRWDDLRATYLGMSARVDEQFDMIVRTLKEEKIYDDTAIFMFSDHGDFTGDYSLVEKTQNTFEDCLTNIPFMIKPHKDVDVHVGIRDTLIELVDFYATVLDFAGIESNHTHFGKSLRAVLADENVVHREAVYSEGGRLQQEYHCTETYNLKWLLREESLYYPRMKVQARNGPEHTKATMCRTKEFKYVKRLYEMDELYDMSNDPGEVHNIIHEKKYKHIVNEFKLRMLDWYQKTADVVPFDEDDRFPDNGLLFMIKPMLPKDVYDKIISELESSQKSLTQILGEIKL